MVFFMQVNQWLDGQQLNMTTMKIRSPSVITKKLCQSMKYTRDELPVSRFSVNVLHMSNAKRKSQNVHAGRTLYPTTASSKKERKIKANV